MPRLIDLTGRRFDRATVMHQDGGNHSGALWRCACSCGTYFTTHGKNLRNGTARSCGCYQRDKVSTANRKHGMSGTKVYAAWVSMLHRCYAVDSQGYAAYGGRGITVCLQWRRSFGQFYADMGTPPPGKTLERKDNSKGYSLSNCEWATPHTQAQNRRTTKLFTFNGETLSVSEWARRHGLPVATVWTRLYRGKSINEALGLKRS